jgi:hypothetical protein
MFAGDTAVCHFLFPAQGNQLAESSVYYNRNIDIQSSRNSIPVIPYNQQNGSKQSPQIGAAHILPADTYHTGFFCKHGYIVYVQRPCNNSVISDNIH